MEPTNNPGFFSTLLRGITSQFSQPQTTAQVATTPPLPPNTVTPVVAEEEPPTTALVTRPRPLAYDIGYTGGMYRNVWSISFNGEKNLGEMGPARNYVLDYDTLRYRSWQAYMDNEIARIVINKFVTTVIGSGLKLKAKPEVRTLLSEGIEMKERQQFNAVVEARFATWADSNTASYNNMQTLHKLASDAFKNCKIGGDVLVVLRYVNGALKVQLIDGGHVRDRQFGNEYYPRNLDNGNRVINGIEVSPTGEHVAYYVSISPYVQNEASLITTAATGTTVKYVRIPAKASAPGLTWAFMVFGNQHRLDNMRGTPIITTVLETLKKLERYKEAAVGSAEERAKIVYQVVHDQHSTGEDVTLDKVAKAFGADTRDIPATVDGKELANTVQVSTNKQTFNMPIGAELKALESKNEMFFKEFYGTNCDIICAAVGIPPNVAFSIYNDSFSSSRAAIKDWEHAVNVYREEFTAQFYQPIYNFFLHLQILDGKVEAPGYLQALAAKNFMVLDAYRNCRFTGSMVPHIDPLKEVKAIREALGPTAANLPLLTLEGAIEQLTGGDASETLEQFAEELERAQEHGISLTNPALDKEKEEEEEPAEKEKTEGEDDDEE